MTSHVSSEMLNPTHSLTHSQNNCFIPHMLVIGWMCATGWFK